MSDSLGDQSFDPRFDPRFQRGYAGGESDAAARRRPKDEVRSSGPSPASPPHHISDPEAQTRPVEPDQPPAPREFADEPSDDVAEPQGEVVGNRARTVLLVASLSMLAAAGVMVWSLAQRLAGDGGSFDGAQQAIAIAQYAVPPALIIAGFCGLILWMVVGVVRAAQAGRR
ncbi:hypothetical protein ACFPJ4_09340 [Lysinimonas soli]|uniref:Uncharacterized protein n=1 Tax=Lysinimonas soli TaxID=1074233 RepID=A0ABW0NT93_9MICO